MVKKSSSGTGGNGGGSNGYKGVRMRKWGKWVSEIRIPRTRDRIWLGSYESAEKAARAYDAAVFCFRGASAGGHYSLNFPQNRSTLEKYLLSSSNASSTSSSATPALNHYNQQQQPSHMTRSQIILTASKYANCTSDNVAPLEMATLPTNSIALSSALLVPDANLALPTNSIALSSALPVPDANLALPTNSPAMSFEFPIQNVNLPNNSPAMSSALPVTSADWMNSWWADKLVASSPTEPSAVDKRYSSSSHSNDGLSSNHFYGLAENLYSPVVEATDWGQSGEGVLEDAFAPHGTSGGGGGGDAFYQPDDPYYCWTY
ncbi:hypothetical protein MKW92_006096 [Papaver armeniacum]|nr:hypothetical protein MKW92_006096 [Papaver armeniacum]